MKNGTENGKYPFEPEISAGSEKTRAELMQLTGKELAKMALPYTTLKDTTLSKLSKAELCDIILSKGKSKEGGTTKKKTQSESEAIINSFLSILETVKMRRENEPLNPTAKQIFFNNATAVVDEKIQDETITSGRINNVVLALTGAFLVLDGAVGIANIPKAFGKIKEKIKNARKTK